jgi:hypothetical protein
MATGNWWRAALALAFAGCSVALAPVALADESSNLPAELDTLTLTHPLRFEGREVSGRVSPKQIEAHFDEKPLGEEGATLTGPKGETRVSTCREWKRLRHEGWYANSDREMFADGKFIGTCGVLFEIAKARRPARSFVYTPRVGLENLDLLPATLLPVVSSHDEEELARLARQGATYASMIEKTDVHLISKEPNSVQVEYPQSGMWQQITELARADFDDDGVEDILVIVEENAQPGMLQSTTLMLLSRRSPSDRFTARTVCGMGSC